MPEPRPRVDKVGVLDEAVASLGQRKVRTALTGLGTLLGVGVLVAVLGLTTTASSQIDQHFTELAATEVTIAQVGTEYRNRTLAFPNDFHERVSRIDGVSAVGLTWRLDADEAVVEKPGPPGSSTRLQVETMAASPGAFEVARATVKQGRIYDEYFQRRASRVAVVGPQIAQELGIVSLDNMPVVSIQGVPFVIIGVLADVRRHPELLNSITIPEATARSIFGDPRSSPAVGWVEVERGAGEVVANQLALAVSPARPHDFTVVPPPSPVQLHGAVSGDLRALFLLLSGVCLIVGMVGIANTMFVTVMERLGEIGLRRALGASRIHIACQFLAEAGIIGVIGGLLGSLSGTTAVIVVSVLNQWTAVMPPWLIVAGPVIGCATALAAAAYPALRGASTQPVTALRSGSN